MITSLLLLLPILQFISFTDAFFLDFSAQTQVSKTNSKTNSKKSSKNKIQIHSTYTKVQKNPYTFKQQQHAMDGFYQKDSFFLHSQYLYRTSSIDFYHKKLPIEQETPSHHLTVQLGIKKKRISLLPSAYFSISKFQNTKKDALKLGFYMSYHQKIKHSKLHFYLQQKHQHVQSDLLLPIDVSSHAMSYHGLESSTSLGLKFSYPLAGFHLKLKSKQLLSSPKKVNFSFESRFNENRIYFDLYYLFHRMKLSLAYEASRLNGELIGEYNNTRFHRLTLRNSSQSKYHLSLQLPDFYQLHLHAYYENTKLHSTAYLEDWPFKQKDNWVNGRAYFKGNINLHRFFLSIASTFPSNFVPSFLSSCVSNFISITPTLSYQHLFLSPKLQLYETDRFHFTQKNLYLRQENLYLGLLSLSMQLTFNMSSFKVLLLGSLYTPLYYHDDKKNPNHSSSQSISQHLSNNFDLKLIFTYYF